MLRKHSLVIAMMNRDRKTAYLIRDYFALPRGTTLMASLCARGLGQADIVLCLLRLHDAHGVRMLRAYVHLLVGRPILVGSPCLLRYRVNGHPTATRAREPGDRRIAFVQPTNPRQPGTAAHARWSEFRVGRSVAQLRTRGVTRRDLRRATRRGWIRMEEVA